MTLAEAWRCINAVAFYLERRDDSPRAAADLRQAANVISKPPPKASTGRVHLECNVKGMAACNVSYTRKRGVSVTRDLKRVTCKVCRKELRA